MWVHSTVHKIRISILLINLENQNLHSSQNKINKKISTLLEWRITKSGHYKKYKHEVQVHKIEKSIDVECTNKQQLIGMAASFLFF